MTSAGRPCVVHLVRAANGREPFDAFLRAWRRHPPGIDCELVLAMKGFPSRDDPATTGYLSEASDLAPQALWFSDSGLDLDVYFDAARQLARDRYCFLNSFSEPLVDGWLARLDEQVRRPDVGLAGATGSWASARSWMLHYMHLPSAYRSVLGGLAGTRQVFTESDDVQGEITDSKPPRSVTRERVAALRNLPEQIFAFGGFPNPHIRTNAFAIRGSTLERLHLPAVHHKARAYRLEGGRRSITSRVARLGLRTVVVDRQGHAYDREQWDQSDTFWQDDQGGLLVADNQTRTYEQADQDRRAILSGVAWGRANPPV